MRQDQLTLIYLFLKIIFNFLIKPTNRLEFFKKYLTFNLPFRKSFNQTEINNEKLEPKINFDEMRNKPVSDFINEEEKEALVEEQNEIFIDELNYKSKLIQRKIALNLTSKFTPKIKFFFDNSFEYSNKINNILETIK